MGKQSNDHDAEIHVITGMNSENLNDLYHRWLIRRQLYGELNLSREVGQYFVEPNAFVPVIRLPISDAEARLIRNVVGSKIRYLADRLEQVNRRTTITWKRHLLKRGLGLDTVATQLHKLSLYLGERERLFLAAKNLRKFTGRKSVTHHKEQFERVQANIKSMESNLIRDRLVAVMTQEELSSQVERREQWMKVQRAREAQGVVTQSRLFDWIRRLSSQHMLQSGYIVIDVQSVAEYVNTEFQKTTNRYEPYFGWWRQKSLLSLPYDHFVLEWRDENAASGYVVAIDRISADGSETTAFTLTLYYLDPAGYVDKHETETIAFDLNGVIVSCTIDDDDRWPLQSAVTLTTLTFLSSHNVMLVDVKLPRLENVSDKRRFIEPLTKYKTLALTSTSKHSDRERKPQQEFDVLSLHFRRGHFRYAPNHPVANFRGLRRIKPTVAGNEKNGIVVKDYKVTR